MKSKATMNEVMFVVIFRSSEMKVDLELIVFLKDKMKPAQLKKHLLCCLRSEMSTKGYDVVGGN